MYRRQQRRRGGSRIARRYASARWDSAEVTLEWLERLASSTLLPFALHLYHSCCSVSQLYDAQQLVASDLSAYGCHGHSSNHILGSTYPVSYLHSSRCSTWSKYRDGYVMACMDERRHDNKLRVLPPLFSAVTPAAAAAAAAVNVSSHAMRNNTVQVAGWWCNSGAQCILGGTT